MSDNNELDKMTERYYDEIYKYCSRRTNNEQDALDITQIVFTILIEHYGKEEINNVKHWLLVVAKNQVNQYYRDTYQNRRYIVDNELEENLQTASYNPFEEISEQELEKMKKVIERSLDKHEQELYQAAFIEKKDYGDVAEQLNISQPTLRKRISRLKIKIKDMIKKTLYCLSLLLIIK